MLNKKLLAIPALPGIYIFKNTNQLPIYIGKAKSLKKRVVSYFRPSHADWKTDILVPEIADIEYIVTKNETEALLLEAELVRTHQPKFNVLLKDGQPFVYIMVSQGALAQLKLVRNKKERGQYFGPFLYKGQARAVYHALIDYLQLYVCNKKIAHGCLHYHMGRCAGTCRTDFDISGYKTRLDIAVAVLNGELDVVQKKIYEQIQTYNKKLEFEKAQKLSLLLEQIDAIIALVRLDFKRSRFDVEISNALRPRDLPDAQLGQQLAHMLGLAQEPVSIDCFDVSHFQGRSLVGSCVRFVNGIPDKNNFRKFIIKTLMQQNDCAALQEIVTRRYRDPAHVPDLILIDGGKGQLHAIQAVMPNACVVSLAKREETVFSAQHAQGLKIDEKLPAGRLLIALRDYAHHVAVSYYRSRARF